MRHRHQMPTWRGKLPQSQMLQSQVKLLNRVANVTRKQSQLQQQLLQRVPKRKCPRRGLAEPAQLHRMPVPV